MSFNEMRIYDSGRICNTELPDWYDEACRISEQDGVDWHRALDRVLDCEHSLLTEEGLISAGLEIRFWPSERRIRLLPGTMICCVPGPRGSRLTPM